MMPRPPARGVPARIFEELFRPPIRELILGRGPELSQIEADVCNVVPRGGTRDHAEEDFKAPETGHGPEEREERSRGKEDRNQAQGRGSGGAESVATGEEADGGCRAPAGGKGRAG